MRVAIPTKDGEIFLRYSETKEFTVYDVEIELVKAKEVVSLGDKTIAEYLSGEQLGTVEENALLRIELDERI